MNYALHKNGIEYLTCPRFDALGVKHIFTTRNGGVSKGCFASLNFAEGSGDVTDSTENVMANYELAARVFGLHKEDVCRSYQDHSANVAVCDEAMRGLGISKPRFETGTDGLVTNVKGLILSVRTADCVPVLLCDRDAGVIAAVHSGWRGTAGKIGANAVQKMIALGANAQNITAAIGPCAGACCYEVGEELKQYFEPECFGYFCGKLHLDLVKANRQVLVECGINKDNIYDSGLCTVCDGTHFYSHRRDGKNRGVMGAFIVL